MVPTNYYRLEQEDDFSPDLWMQHMDQSSHLLLQTVLVLRTCRNHCMCYIMASAWRPIRICNKYYDYFPGVSFIGHCDGHYIRHPGHVASDQGTAFVCWADPYNKWVQYIYVCSGVRTTMNYAKKWTWLNEGNCHHDDLPYELHHLAN